MNFNFITNSAIQRYDKGKRIQIPQKATLGTFFPININDIKRYVRKYPKHWINL